MRRRLPIRRQSNKPLPVQTRGVRRLAEAELLQDVAAFFAAWSRLVAHLERRRVER